MSLVISMFKKLVSSAKESGYQKVRKKGVRCPDCGNALDLPEHLPEAGFGMTLKCSHCSWMGGLSSLISHGSRDQLLSSRKEKPEGSKIKEVIGEVKASWLIPAKRKFNFLMFFALFWLLVTGAFTFGLLFGGVQVSGDMPLWGGMLFLGIFWLIGLGMGYAGLRMAYTELLVRVDENAVILTRRFFKKMWSHSIPRDQVKRVSLGVAYTQNEVPVYQLEIKNTDGKDLKFGSSLSLDEKRWLLGGLESVLGKSSGEKIAQQGQVDGLFSGASDLSGLEELKTKSLTVQSMGRGGVRIIRRYTAGPVLMIAGLITMIGDFVWMGSMWSDHSVGESSDGIARVIDFLFSSLPLIFSLVGLVVGGALMAGGFWVLGRKILFEFDRDGLKVQTEWRGKKTQKQFSKSEVLRVDVTHSGNVNNQPRFAVAVVTESENLKICGFEPDDVADTVKLWVDRWIAGK